MPNREPEPWESGAATPFLWIETARGNVEVWALGEDRFSDRGVMAKSAARAAPAGAGLGYRRPGIRGGVRRPLRGETGPFFATPGAPGRWWRREGPRPGAFSVLPVGGGSQTSLRPAGLARRLVGRPRCTRHWTAGRRRHSSRGEGFQGRVLGCTAPACLVAAARPLLCARGASCPRKPMVSARPVPGAIAAPRGTVRGFLFRLSPAG
jgi:hypothetical protein